MRKRLTLTIAAACVLLAAAAPALLAVMRSTAPDPYATPVPFGWSLQMRGHKNLEMSRAEFRRLVKAKNHAVTMVVDENKPTTADPADDTTFQGVSLAQLVGVIDDGNPATFNKGLATTGTGYGVEVMGIDYFSYVYTSQQIAQLGKALIVADLANGQPLTWGAVSGTSFKPRWPLKLVSLDPSITGKMKPSGIMRISIVAAPTPSPSPSASASVSSPFEPRVSAKEPDGGWKLTLQGKRTKVLPIAKVPATVAWHGELAGNINPSLRYVYKGQTLFKLVGLVDDNKAGFNVAKAKKGYKIRFICRDGYKPQIPSKWIVGKKHWIIAKIKDGKLLQGDEGPFRFVGGKPITQPFNNKLSAYGVIRIRLIF